MNFTYTNTIRLRALGKNAMGKNAVEPLIVNRVALLTILLLTILPLTAFPLNAYATEPENDTFQCDRAEIQNDSSDTLCQKPMAFGIISPSAIAPSSLLLPSDSIVPDPAQQVRPRTGAQMFQQRWAALAAGQTYTQLPPHSFEAQWQREREHPGYGEWLDLLEHEAQSMAHGQGDSALTVIVGDSLTQRIPTEFLPQDRFWLNQSISGETAALITKRLHLFAHTRPDAIHVMAGINDLKNGATDDQVLSSLRTLMRQLRHQHPNAAVTVHSILPTRWPDLPGDRIQSINQHLMTIAHQEEVEFLDLQPHFTDDQGNLHSTLTTDGLHLNYRGYEVWQSVMHQF